MGKGEGAPVEGCCQAQGQDDQEGNVWKCVRSLAVAEAKESKQREEEKPKEDVYGDERCPLQ